MESLYEIGCFILFVLEGFLAMAHLHVALSLRALPLKDMARLQYFFLFAMLTIATTWQLVTSPFWMLGAFLLAHHLYSYMTWNVSSYTKKLIMWSSLNWSGSRIKNLPLFIGALCAAFLHGHHAYLLTSAFDVKLLVLALLGVHSAVMAVLYNSKLAWASPSSVPDWVAKRVADSNKSMKHD